jgi:uncharacterized membrane protein
MTIVSKFKPMFRILLAVLMIADGILHLWATETFMTIMPAYFPWHRELVLISGVVVIFGGIGLLIPVTRPVAGIALMVLYAAVLPANINMVVNNIQPEDFDIPAVFLWLRLPLQLAIVVWAWWVSRPYSRPHSHTHSQ